MPVYQYIRFMVSFQRTKMRARMYVCLKTSIQHISFSFAKHCRRRDNRNLVWNTFKNITHA